MLAAALCKTKANTYIDVLANLYTLRSSVHAASFPNARLDQIGKCRNVKVNFTCKLQQDALFAATAFNSIDTLACAEGSASPICEMSTLQNSMCQN
eukprot:8401-Heterococcus_DN1.PRE.2